MSPRKTGPHTTYLRSYSLDGFIDAAVEQGAPRYTGGDEWAGGSFLEAVRLARGGYEPDNPSIDEIVSSIETALADRMLTTFEAVYDVTGAAVDIGRYLAGEPECMIESTPIKVMRTGRVLRIAVPVGISAGTDQKAINRRGAAVMALLEILGRLQFPLEIYAVVAMQSQSKNGRLAYAVKCVGTGDVMDRSRVAYALCHSTMFRRLGFAVMDGDEMGKDFGAHGYYGVPSWAAETSDLQINDENAIVLPQLTMFDKWPVDECVRWVKEQVDRIQGQTV